MFGLVVPLSFFARAFVPVPSAFPSEIGSVASRIFRFRMLITFPPWSSLFHSLFFLLRFSFLFPSPLHAYLVPPCDNFNRRGVPIPWLRFPPGPQSPFPLSWPSPSGFLSFANFNDFPGSLSLFVRDLCCFPPLPPVLLVPPCGFAPRLCGSRAVAYFRSQVPLERPFHPFPVTTRQRSRLVLSLNFQMIFALCSRFGTILGYHYREI